MNNTFRHNYHKVRYAPDGEYIKDHCFFHHDNLWHLFSISGSIGQEMSTTKGNEEKFSHSVSPDLCEWKFIDHCLSIAEVNGADMIWAPYVVAHDNRFYMLFTECLQPNRDPVNWKIGAKRKLGLAVSSDLYNWKYQPMPQEITGKDPHLMLHAASGRWLLYMMDGKYPGMTCWTSENLHEWHDPVQTFCAAPEETKSRNIYESPYILYYPGWKKYVLLLNLGFSVSDTPFEFKGFQEYECSAVPVVSDAWLQNQKYFHPQLGFAGEVIQMDGKYYRSSCYGPRNAWKIKFFSLEFKNNSASPPDTHPVITVQI